MGLIFQSFALVPLMSAYENVEFAMRIAGVPAAEYKSRTEEVLEYVGLKKRMKHRPFELSGGEQQRVAIARAVAKRPEVMLCDEPTGALDSKTGVLVLDALMQTNRELGTTTAIITHNAPIQALAHRVLHFSDGRISEVTENTRRLSPADIDW